MIVSDFLLNMNCDKEKPITVYFLCFFSSHALNEYFHLTGTLVKGTFSALAPFLHAQCKKGKKTGENK